MFCSHRRRRRRNRLVLEKLTQDEHQQQQQQQHSHQRRRFTVLGRARTHRIHSLTAKKTSTNKFYCTADKIRASFGRKSATIFINLETITRIIFLFITK